MRLVGKPTGEAAAELDGESHDVILLAGCDVMGLWSDQWLIGVLDFQKSPTGVVLCRRPPPMKKNHHHHRYGCMV